MDDKTFDSLAKLSATSTGRRRLLQAAGAAGFGSLLTRGAAGAQDVVAEACQNLQSKCKRNRQCQCKDRRNVICDPLSTKGNCRSGNRCCGTAQAECREDCDCCKGYKCNTNRRECENA